MHTLLKGTRVLEFAHLAPDMLGMHLADLGAEVIKIEQPPAGDPARVVGGRTVGGESLMHLRWNRGKKSVVVDLKRSEGQALIGRLAAHADVVIDGLRAGAAARLGADHATLTARNPRLVYCTLSGTGTGGPYERLATHGIAYDAYAGLAPPATHADGSPRISHGYVPIGMLAAPLYAAMAVCAALLEARHTGRGRRLEIAEIDAAVAWQAAEIDARLNHATGARPDMTAAVRYQYYRAADDRLVIFQATEMKFWRNFCTAVGRDDLFEAKPGGAGSDHAAGDEDLRAELAAIFKTRTRGEWVRFFIAHDVPGGPVYDAGEIPDDPHFRARDLVITQDHPRAGRLALFGTPVKVDDQRGAFASPSVVAAAPALGAHTDEILAGLAGCGRVEIAALRAGGVVA
jgi:crotonobetainyl-CoA:carnitine CoA-transferase CaiB-like acyl-CoA transferase